VAVGAAKGLGQLDRLVDDDAVGRFRVVGQFEARPSAGRRLRSATSSLNGRSMCAATKRRQLFVLADHPAQGTDEEIAVGLGEILHLGDLGFDGGFIGTADAPLVEALQYEFTGAAAGRPGRRLGFLPAPGVAGEDGH
jgi:hypothetical protein